MGLRIISVESLGITLELQKVLKAVDGHSEVLDDHHESLRVVLEW
jgi:hypothetical protein